MKSGRFEFKSRDELGNEKHDVHKIYVSWEKKENGYHFGWAISRPIFPRPDPEVMYCLADLRRKFAECVRYCEEPEEPDLQIMFINALASARTYVHYHLSEFSKETIRFADLTFLRICDIIFEDPNILTTKMEVHPDYLLSLSHRMSVMMLGEDYIEDKIPHTEKGKL